MSIFYFTLAISMFALGAIGALLFKRENVLANWWSNGCAAVGSLIALAFSSSVLISGAVLSWQADSLNSLLSLSVHIDRLSAAFIFLISLISLFASMYSIGYSRHYDTDEHRVGILGFYYNIFLAGMLLVVSAYHSMYFLVVWEIMSLASYFLVIFEKDSEENQKAGVLYFVMTHVGTACLMVAFLLLHRVTGSYDFGVIKDQLGSVGSVVKNAVFLLCLIGFGTKAGMIPFHVWLPKAHPAAPSFVSALMSGVMIKTGIYMLIRILMDMMPVAPVWWGALIVAMGSCSAFFGVLYALAEGDLKKLLAYCSIENVGIILIGFGASMVFWSLNMVMPAIIALSAALFHTLNHAIYKSLLFFCAGSVISATHTRNMEAYGGLIKRMPITSACFLVGSMAISALPPFNGFFSEWMTIQALFRGVMGVESGIRWIFMLAISALVFAGGLAAMTFVKAFGISFLARPRTPAAEKAKEVSMSLRVSMIVLSALTLVVGFFARDIVALLYRVVGGLGAFHTVDFGALALSDSYTDGASSISMMSLFAGLAGVLFVTWLVIRLTTKRRVVRYVRTWDCGTSLGPRMEITPMGFSRTMVLIFKGILLPSRQTMSQYRDADMRYFSKPESIELGLKDVYQAYLYGPLQRVVALASEFAKKIQNGNVNAYVAYILLTLIALLFASRLF